MPADVFKIPQRFLIIGCGSIGKRHIRNLVANGVVEILAFDIIKDRRCDMESQFNLETVDTLEEAWEQKPEVVLITTPTSTHVPLALQSAEHRCHLFIEKPLSDRLDGVDELLETVQNRNLVTLVGCNMRFHPGLVRIKKSLEQGLIGRVVAARVEVGQYLPDWHPWEDYRQGYSARRDLGGGVILDAIHELDYIGWMLGGVESVACLAGHLSHLEIETEDTAAILLRFASGAIGEIHMDYVQCASSRTCHLIGDGGTIRWDYSSGEVRWYSAATREWQTFPHPSDWDPNRMYLDEMKHFLKCLSGEGKPAQDVADAARTLRIALAAKASAETEHFVNIRD
jgi:predicted dehydrogenase